MAASLTLKMLVFFQISITTSFGLGQLSSDFYSKSCPALLHTVRSALEPVIDGESRMGASLLRLHFHDCFVNGCDASVLLDDTPTFTGEKKAFPNLNSARGFEVVDKLKSAVELVCPGIVSCADILTLAARDSVVLLGGPSWQVKLGRRDSRSANQSAANSNLPGPTLNLDGLVSSFKAQGLSLRDLVALSGAHTIGMSRCTNFRERIYNETDMDEGFAKKLQRMCPRNPGSGDNSLASFDRTTTTFDSKYYEDIVNHRGLLHSDQELHTGDAAAIVDLYSKSPENFALDFSAAMIRMGDLNPLKGTEGEIRKNCRKLN